MLGAVAHNSHLFRDIAVRWISFFQAWACHVVLESVTRDNEVSLNVVLLEISISLTTTTLFYFVIIAKTVQRLLCNVHATLRDQKL